jgi:hypothetical protein
MEQQSQNTEGIKVIGYAIIPIHLFFAYFILFRHSTNIAFLDNIYLSLNPKIALIKNPFFAHFIALILFSIHALTTPIGKDRALMEKTVIRNTIFGLITIFLASLLFFVLPYSALGFLLYFLILAVGYYFFINHISLIMKLITMRKNDVFNFENETFPQMEEKIETEHSINIPYYFYFQGKWRKGWLNFVNPFRAILVAGSPGSGKSFGTINLAIHQLIHKEYCLYVYDFKLPTLAIEVINALWHYKELLKQRHGSIENWEKKHHKKFPKYYQIDLQNPITSHRINPISSRLVKEMIDATESAKFIMQGLSGAAANNEGDFFQKSAELLLTATIYYLKRKSEQYGKEFCSLPHVIEFLKQDYEIFFPLLMSDMYVKGLATTFDRAFKGGALEQLQGQVDSLVIMLGQIVDPTVYWVFTGEDFDLNISNPENPSVLVIGNNPDRFQSYGVLLSLLNGKLTKTINKKGQLPLGIIVDECPTLPFESVSTLIATARSNKVACILGIQDLAQFVLLYGQEKANMIVNMVGSILTGQIRGELAKIVSECIGKINQTNIQESLSAQGTTSYSISDQQIEAVPVSTISNLDQGEMAGTISGDFKSPLKYRRFHGRIDAMDYQASPTTQMPIKSIPELNEKFKRMKNESEEDRNLRVEIAVRENYERIRKDINLILYLELCRFDIQKMDKVADIRLNLIGDAMLKYICKINQYQGENGLTLEGEKFKVKIDSMLTLFANQIRHFIYMEESEVQNKYANNSIVYAPKTLLTDFNSPTCKALQVQYNQFELLLYNEVEDPRFTINAPEEEFFA